MKPKREVKKSRIHFQVINISIIDTIEFRLANTLLFGNFKFIIIWMRIRFPNCLDLWKISNLSWIKNYKTWNFAQFCSYLHIFLVIYCENTKLLALKLFIFQSNIYFCTKVSWKMWTNYCFINQSASYLSWNKSLMNGCIYFLKIRSF
jgi:hypothetical protein